MSEKGWHAVISLVLSAFFLLMAFGYEKKKKRFVGSAANKDLYWECHAKEWVAALAFLAFLLLSAWYALF